MVIGEQATSVGPALLRKLKTELPQFPWLADGEGNPNNKVDMRDYVKEVLAQPSAPKREAESDERTHRITSRFEEARADAAALRGMLIGEEDEKAWWRTYIRHTWCDSNADILSSRGVTSAKGASSSNA